MFIESLIELNEGKTVEFKETLQSLNGVIKTIVAFANTAGGTIIIGVEDKTKKIVGVSNPLLEEERLAGAINNNIAPMLMPDIQIYAYKNKELIVIQVPHATGPYYLKSAGIEKGTYVRLGSTNRAADQERIQSLKNFARNIIYDEQPYITKSKEDLDWDAIQNLFKEAHKTISTQNAENMGILTTHDTKTVPSFGGIILFGKDHLKDFPDAKIRCARFAGTIRDVIIDRSDIEIYLPFAIEESIKFIQRNTKLSSQIEGLRRKDIPEYPPKAIREILTNAVMHADYSISGVCISIAIFDDKIEITNPGTLPFGITIEKILSGASRSRNRVIAKVFYHLKWVEQWGRGISSIISECKKHGLVEPKFEELNNQFRVTLYSRYSNKKNNAKTLTIKEDEEWDEIITKYLSKKKKMNTQMAATIWNVTPRTARTRLIKMQNCGKITRVSSSLKDPKSYYILAKKS